MGDETLKVPERSGLIRPATFDRMLLEDGCLCQSADTLMHSLLPNPKHTVHFHSPMRLAERFDLAMVVADSSKKPPPLLQLGCALSLVSLVCETSARVGVLLQGSTKCRGAMREAAGRRVLSPPGAVQQSCCISGMSAGWQRSSSAGSGGHMQEMLEAGQPPPEDPSGYTRETIIQIRRFLYELSTPQQRCHSC